MKSLLMPFAVTQNKLEIKFVIYTTKYTVLRWKSFCFSGEKVMYQLGEWPMSCVREPVSSYHLMRWWKFKVAATGGVEKASYVSGFMRRSQVPYLTSLLLHVFDVRQIANGNEMSCQNQLDFCVRLVYTHIKKLSLSLSRSLSSG